MIFVKKCAYSQITRKSNVNMRKISFLILIGFICLLFTSCEKYTTSITDINVYVNEDYANEDVFDNEWITNAGKLAKQVFPKYEEINYNYDKIEFYLYSNNMMRTIDTTFVLELTFDSFAEYELAKNDIYSRYEFLDEKVKEGVSTLMPSNEFKIGNYFARIAVTSVDKYPKRFLAICTNEETMTIRYLFCYDTDTDAISSTSKLIKAINKASNCSW